MPRTARIKRKNAPRTVKRRIKSSQRQRQQQQQPQQPDIDITNLPPHLLDKIPSQMSLRPTAQSLRAMMMQRLAPPFMQMPMLTPQQQQVQNMKTTNDIKEQAINQAKQDMIVESERKRALQKEVADHKREQSQLKHELDHEELTLKEREKLAKTDNELKLRKRKVDFDKEMTSNEATAARDKHQLETQEALLAQAKLNNQKLKNDYETHARKQRGDRLQRELEATESDNEGLRMALEELDSERALDNFKTLARQIALGNARGMLYKKLHEERTKQLQYELENACQATPEMLKSQMTTMENDIKACQTSIAAQMDKTLVRDRDMKMQQHIQKTLIDKQIEEKQLEFEHTALDEKIKVHDTERDKTAINDLIKRNAEKDVENKLQKQWIEAQEDLEKGQQQVDKYNATIDFMNNEQYGAMLRDIQLKKGLAQTIDEHSALHRSAIESHRRYLESLSENSVSSLIAETQVNGGDVREALEGMISTRMANPNQITRAFQLLAAQNQTANQENDERATIVNHLRSVSEAQGVESEILQHYFSQHVTGDFNNFLTTADLQSLRNFNREFGEYLQVHRQRWRSTL